LAVASVAAFSTSCAQDAPESLDPKSSQSAEVAPNKTGPKKTDPKTVATAKKPDADPVANLRAAIGALMNKTEHTAPRVVVQHILIGFQGSVRGKPITRSRDEAEALAAKLFFEIQNGGDFDALVKQHTDDAYPGRYPMTLDGRSRMVQGFGDVGWRLEVDEVGVAPHEARKSPFGWHIIKRVE
jgi:PPIC-type PPIASE domain